MKSIALGVSVFLVLIGTYVSRSYQLQNVQKRPQEVLSDEIQVEEEPSPTITTATLPSPTQIPTSNKENVVPNSYSDFYYPGATTKEQTDSRLVLESSDDAGKITDWYKKKINDKNMSAVSFVSTTANDDVLNRLEGAENEETVSIEIERKSGSATTTISVSLRR